MCSTLVDSVSEAITTGAEALFAVQRPDGVFAFDSRWWSSTLGTAAAVTALHFADPDGSAALIGGGVEWLCRAQQSDGGWSTMPGQAPEAVPTAVTAAVLHMLAPERAAVKVRAARGWVEAFGGLDAIPDPAMVRVCRQFYAFAGLRDTGLRDTGLRDTGLRDTGSWDTAALPRLPLEIVLFPAWCRRRLSFRVPIFAAVAVAQARLRRHGPVRGLLNRLAEPVALSLVRQVYEHEGRTGEMSGDAWAAGQVCIGLARAGVAPDLVQAITGWLRSTAVPDGSWDLMALDLTWSSFAAAGLVEAGYGDDPRLARAREMFHSRQQDKPFTAFGCPPGYWGFSGARGWPMALETAEVTSVLANLPGGGTDEHMRRGVGWLSRQQDRRGSWSLSVRDTVPGGLGPCPYMTCQAVDALLDSGVPASDPRVARALRWVFTQQRPGGEFEAMWYRDHTAGTSVVLETLARVGLAGHPVAVRARDWLVRTQLGDGSWSTGNGTGAGGAGESTVPGSVEETAWALRALLAAGLDPGEPVVAHAVRWLLEAQCPDGRWPQAPVSWFIRHCSCYPNGGITMGLALRALARYRAAAQRETPGATAGETA